MALRARAGARCLELVVRASFWRGMLRTISWFCSNLSFANSWPRRLMICGDCGAKV